MTKSRTCFGCKETFNSSSLVQYASPNSTVMHWYCPKCLQEKTERDRFSSVVCNIFGLKAPGPRIWTERKRLIDTYGYTDDQLINCLEYLYKIKGLKKLSESLCLINPKSMSEMYAYKQRQENESKRPENMARNITNAAAKTEIKNYLVSVFERNREKVKQLNPDDWWDDNDTDR